jgi:hypothetical protein
VEETDLEDVTALRAYDGDGFSLVNPHGEGRGQESRVGQIRFGLKIVSGFDADVFRTAAKFLVDSCCYLRLK